MCRMQGLGGGVPIKLVSQKNVILLFDWTYGNLDGIFSTISDPEGSSWSLLSSEMGPLVWQERIRDRASRPVMFEPWAQPPAGCATSGRSFASHFLLSERQL